MRIVILANGEPPDASEVRAWLRPNDQLICADGGARAALQLDLRPTIVIGDFDSLSTSEIGQLEDAGTRLIRHPREKDETDLELALLCAAGQAPNEIVILGAHGGRTDHMLANIMLLALPQLNNIDVCIAWRNERMFLLHPNRPHTVMGEAGDTLSLLPLGGDVPGIETFGLQYALHNEPLRFGPARGVSNVMLGASASVQFASGRLLCVHCKVGDNHA